MKPILALLLLTGLALGGPILKDAKLTGTATVPSGAAISFASGSTLTLTSGLTLAGSITSAQLAGIVSNETGSSALVFGTSPTLTTPTISQPAITGGTVLSLAGFSILDAGADHQAIITFEDNTGEATLNIDLRDASRTIDLAGGLTLAAAFSTSGGHAVTLTTSGATNVTLPTTGTLATTTDLTSYQPLDTQLTDLAGLSYAGNALKVIRVNAGETGVELAASAGTGDVVGPGSATDNAAVRFDSTTGKLVQNSVVIIGDTGNVTGLGTLNTHTIPAGTSTFATLGANNAFTGDNTFTTSLAPFAVTTGIDADQQSTFSIQNTGTTLATTDTSAGDTGYVTTNSGSATIGYDGAASASALILEPGGAILSNTDGGTFYLNFGGGTTAGELRFLEPSGGGTSYTGFKAPALAGSVIYTLPTADGSANQVLATNGSAALSWANQKILGTASSSSASLISATTVMPFDDTIPQNTEGDEALTVSYTPVNASSTIEVTFSGMIGGATSARIVIGLFKDSGADALYATSTTNVGSTGAMQTAFTYRESAASTSARTYKIRFGPQSGTAYMNGTNGSRAFGGTCKAEIVITEIAP